MSIPYFQINAFTSSLFSGNPAGVCLLADWLPDPVLQSIAAENNLADLQEGLGISKTSDF